MKTHQLNWAENEQNADIVRAARQGSYNFEPCDCSSLNKLPVGFGTSKYCVRFSVRHYHDSITYSASPSSNARGRRVVCVASLVVMLGGVLGTVGIVNAEIVVVAMMAEKCR